MFLICNYCYYTSLWVKCLLIYLISEEHRNAISGMENKISQKADEMEEKVDNLEITSEAKFVTLAGKSIKCY